MNSITFRLLTGFFLIILIFGLVGLYITKTVNATGNESRQFVKEYWPTTSLVMNARLSTAQLTALAFSPPKGEAAMTLLENAHDEIERLRREFSQAPLESAELLKLDPLFEQLSQNIIAPIHQFNLPGEQMEIADAAVGPVLKQIEELGDVDLTNAIWEGVMAFNDILITHDPAERLRFQTQMLETRNNSRFSVFEDNFKVFEQEALLVFDVAEELYASQQRFKESSDQLAAALGELENRYEQSVVLPASQSVLTNLASITKAFGTALMVCILLSLVIGLYLSRDIGKATRRTVGMIQALAKGELYQRLEMRRKDEIGIMAKALNGTADHLAGLVGRIGDVAGSLAQASEGISDVSGNVSEAADRQALEVKNTTEALLAIKKSMQAVGDSVEELAASTELAAQSSLEMAANIEQTAATSEGLSKCAEQAGSSILEMVAAQRQVTENVQLLKSSSDTTLSAVAETETATRQVEAITRETLGIVANAERDALDGQQAVNMATQGIAAISQASDNLFKNIQNLKHNTDSIGTILTVIEDINSETSLLALNAAIIAAQSGSHGHAFSVVAEEIRELSKRTGQSTEEITRIIHGVQEETAQAVNSLDQAGESIRDGSRLSHHSGKALEKIVDGFGKVTQQMELIAAATDEQSKNSNVIQKAMHDVSIMINQISIATNEQDKSNNLIQSIANQLQEMSAQVRQATHEQSSASRVIGNSTEEINQRIQQIQAACAQHDEQSLQVEQAVQQISSSAGSNVTASDRLEAGVADLTDQVTVLQQEMRLFKTSAPLV